MKHSMLRATLFAATALISGTFAMPAMAGHATPDKVVIELPAISGWYDGRAVLYIQTEASDPAVAAAQGVNYVPALANVLTANPSASDDIYVITNFTQSNIIPSAPTPAGAGNTSQSYSPLWQVSTVTWADPKKATTLRSEADVLAALAAKWVTVTKTNIVVNCAVIYSPQGGKLPTAHIDR